jgi:hypothetical protein
MDRNRTGAALVAPRTVGIYEGADGELYVGLDLAPLGGAEGGARRLLLTRRGAALLHRMMAMLFGALCERAEVRR